MANNSQSNDGSTNPQNDFAKWSKLITLLKHNGVILFEYDMGSNVLSVYDENMETEKVIPSFMQYIAEKSGILPEDIGKVESFFMGEHTGPMEFRRRDKKGRELRKMIIASPCENEAALIGCVWDVTVVTEREHILEKIAQKDSLTGLYNHATGKRLASKYLISKDPYSSCGLMVIDIDYFKSVNDTYGHLFGDNVLKSFAQLLKSVFDGDDILIRAGGDEFVVFSENTGHSMLVQKATQLVDAARRIPFEHKEYRMTCSVGVCFLPENMVDSYDQLFDNADQALYRAKEDGRNRYVFCDNLRHFEKTHDVLPENEIDARYFRNDAVATAFEIFEKMNDFDIAIRFLMEVIGIRYQLDRITVINTNIREQNTTRQYQWTSPEAPEALSAKSEFTRKDFLTLFHSYDEYGTTVLQYDDMDMYSDGAKALLMQGEAKTVVYAAMYSEGRYTGAISYGVWKDKRYWSKQSRREFGEITKIIAAYLSRHLMAGATVRQPLLAPDVDSLTGLLSFSRFREEAEQKIVAGYASSYAMVCCNFVDFNGFNEKFGFTGGDVLLREFSRNIMNSLLTGVEAYFTRAVADHFVIFMPYTDRKELAARIDEMNDAFIEKQKQKYADMDLQIRVGIYYITEDCMSASAAIDAAYAACRGNSASVVNKQTDERSQIDFV